MIVLLMYLFLHALLIYSWEYRLITDFNAISLWLGGSVLQVNDYLSSLFLRYLLNVARCVRHQFLHMIRMLHLKIFKTMLLFMMGIVVSSLRLSIMSNSRWIHRPFTLKLDNCLRWTSKILTRGALIWYLLCGLTWKWRDRLPESESCITLHHWACVLVNLLIIRMILMSFITGVESSSIKLFILTCMGLREKLNRFNIWVHQFDEPILRKRWTGSNVKFWCIIKCDLIIFHKGCHLRMRLPISLLVVLHIVMEELRISKVFIWL
jgi:hypothetical protein